MVIEKLKHRRRIHSQEFKEELVRACGEPGVSVAGIAMAKGVNANLVRRWMAERGVCAPSLRQRVMLADPVIRASEFVPVTVAPPEPAAAAIRIEVRRGNSVVKVEWPLQAAGACSAWLRKWLR